MTSALGTLRFEVTLLHKTTLWRQNRIVTILWKRVLKQAVGRGKEKSEIATIPNKYKDSLDDLIDSSNTESLDQPGSPDRLGPIDKGLRNSPRSRGTSTSVSKKEEDRLDEDVLVTLLKLAPKTQDSQVYKRHDIAPLSPKSGRAQYEEGQKGGEDGKDKGGG